MHQTNKTVQNNLLDTSIHSNNKHIQSNNRHIHSKPNYQYHFRHKITPNSKFNPKSQNIFIQHNHSTTYYQQLQTDQLLTSDQRQLNTKLNFVLNMKQKRLKSPPQILNIDLNKLNTEKSYKINQSQYIDDLAYQNDLRQKLRLHSPQNIMNNQAVQNTSIKVNQSVSNKLQLRMHSLQNDTQRNSFKAPLIQKNKFPKVFADIKNINIQESINTVENETKKTEVINHHINLSSLKTESTKNTETKFDFENVNCGYLKRNPKINIGIKQNSKANSQQTFQQIMQNLRKMKTHSVQLKPQKYQLNQIVTIKKLLDSNYQSKKVLYLKHLELLVLSEIKLESIIDIQQIKTFLQNWKQQIQIQNDNSIQIKELYWNSPEDCISILCEDLKYDSIKKMIESNLESINITGIKYIIKQILNFVNLNQSNIDMIVNYDLIHSDNIYLVNNGKIKIGLNLDFFLRKQNQSNSFRQKQFQLLIEQFQKSQLQYNEQILEIQNEIDGIVQDKQQLLLQIYV